MKILYVILGCVGFFGSGFLTSKLTTKYPDCVCANVVVPPCPKCPDYQFQSIDIDKIKGVRGLTLNQNFIVKLDSVNFYKLKCK